MIPSAYTRLLPLASFAAAALSGCGGSSAPAGGSAQAVPAQIPLSESLKRDGGTLTVGIRIEQEQTYQSKHYGTVFGYFRGTKSRISEVVKLSANMPVVFSNVDGSQHTASFLGDATKKNAPWPKKFNGSATASPAGTDIGTSDFSTGTVQPLTSSAVYNTGAPGFYMFGCWYHYDSEGQRTVIIVQ